MYISTLEPKLNKVTLVATNLTYILFVSTYIS